MRRRILALPLFALAALPLVTSCGPSHLADSVSVAKSLTLDGAASKKYYFGWGQYLDGSMGNETKYDVKHTHDIFASGQGGNYQSTTIVDRDFSTDEVSNTLSKIASGMTKDDMYVQYSSGHGYEGGLAVGGDYSSLVNTALGMQAKEIVIFTMACFSGTEVNAFNERKSDWQNFAAQGRSLFVMSSSSASETSSTGPGTDDSESGPDGSAGSAYGHSLWKTLTGEADGSIDGVKDGFISLGEIAAYATKKTLEISGQMGSQHKPQVTGIYNPNLIMNRVPGQQYVANQVRENAAAATQGQ